MKAYSVDLREKVLRAVDQGYSRAEIINLFGVSRATIKRYLKQRRETGNISAKSIPGRPSKKYAPWQAGLTAQLQVYPDATLQMHCQMWEPRAWLVGKCHDHGASYQATRMDQKKTAWAKAPTEQR